MKLYIKQKVFAMSDKFHVKNEFGKNIYTVQGSLFRIPKRFEVYSMEGTRVMTIKKRLFRIFPQYTIQTHDRTVVLKKSFKFLRDKFTIGNINWKIKGDILNHNYQITSRGKRIMKLTKRWFTWGDSYEIDIQNSNDVLLCLGIAICVDADIAESERNLGQQTTQK